jgi:hypothetical protein
MTFLKKLGTILANVAGIAVGIGPIIQPFLGSGKAGAVAGTVVNDLTQIGSLVAVLESAGVSSNLTGPQKLQALIPLVANIVKTSELVSGKKIADDAKFTLGCQEIAQGVVDVLNSIHEDAAKQA